MQNLKTEYIAITKFLQKKKLNLHPNHLPTVHLKNL